MFNNERYLISKGNYLDGVQYRFLFPNGYGASVLKNPYSYGGNKGLWEITVLYNDLPTYDTPITDYILGWKNDQEVAKILLDIRELPWK